MSTNQWISRLWPLKMLSFYGFSIFDAQLFRRILSHSNSFISGVFFVPTTSRRGTHTPYRMPPGAHWIWPCPYKKCWFLKKTFAIYFKISTSCLFLCPYLPERLPDTTQILINMIFELFRKRRVDFKKIVKKIDLDKLFEHFEILKKSQKCFLCLKSVISKR